MTAILDALMTWALLQILFVWVCARFAGRRELELRRYLAGASPAADTGEIQSLPGPDGLRARPRVLPPSPNVDAF
jgi:hypothetical protein